MGMGPAELLRAAESIVEREALTIRATWQVEREMERRHRRRRIVLLTVAGVACLAVWLAVALWAL